MVRYTMFMNQKIRVSSFPNWLINLAQFQLKLQDFVVDTDKLILKIYTGRQRNWNNQNNVLKNKIGGLTLCF